MEASWFRLGRTKGQLSYNTCNGHRQSMGSKPSHIIFANTENGKIGFYVKPTKKTLKKESSRALVLCIHILRVLNPCFILRQKQLLIYFPFCKIDYVTATRTMFVSPNLRDQQQQSLHRRGSYVHLPGRWSDRHLPTGRWVYKDEALAYR